MFPGWNSLLRPVRTILTLLYTAVTLANSEDQHEMPQKVAFHRVYTVCQYKKKSSGTEIHLTLNILTRDPFVCV